ncbi:hypothetical protein PAECIP111891_04607 [Paenibacillus allorhizoplanae]|uniref:SIS domain-containing protein n=1 Tax=Paenibacillus allorhizoplanae TaxID=2905648 RepID=A0ABM9CLA0_9BACL|nr:SIS domain-containing protein [Paenibacillus allorhizoplanae]CAH1217630.1 hypothetical protein PAECIP111891_04607 [Paenibacillus allorhizoplanae]
MNIGANVVIDTILDIVQTFRSTQMEPLQKASKLLSKSLLEGGVIHVFGAGHSRTFGMEMCGRAGGLVPLNLVGLEDISRIDNRIGINLVDLEREPKTAHDLLDLHDVRKEDSIIIVSNSGRNGAPNELAIESKRRGLSVIAVTSLLHSTNSDSRHPSGKKLYEIADIVIDNCCPYGDVLLEIPGISEKTGSASTVVGVFIAQALTVEIIAEYVQEGRIPPVYISANVDGGDEHNRKLQEKYEHRNITY